MKIKMKKLAAGPDGVMHPGKEYDMSDATGKQLVDGGYAERVVVEKPDKPEIETAMVEPSETAVKPEAKAKKKK